MSKASEMRALLASAGIVLDEKPAALEPRPTIATGAAPVDRAVIREILIDRGAPASDLEWLTASCPSVRDAEDYRPPPIMSWCMECGDVQPVDAGGCVTCRAKPEMAAASRLEPLEVRERLLALPSAAMEVV